MDEAARKIASLGLPGVILLITMARLVSQELLRLRLR